MKRYPTFFQKSSKPGFYNLNLKIGQNYQLLRQKPARFSIISGGITGQMAGIS